VLAPSPVAKVEVEVEVAALWCEDGDVKVWRGARRTAWMRQRLEARMAQL
jgi:hypothetical protein